MSIAAAHDPNSGFDIFTILGVVGIILGIIVLALRVASHGQMDYTRHGDVGFTVAERDDDGADACGCEAESRSECVGSK
jgi:hypothetical protein